MKGRERAHARDYVALPNLLRASAFSRIRVDNRCVSRPALSGRSLQCDQSLVAVIENLPEQASHVGRFDVDLASGRYSCNYCLYSADSSHSH